MKTTLFKQPWTEAELKLLTKLIKKDVSPRNIFLGSYFLERSYSAIYKMYIKQLLKLIKLEISKLVK